MKRSDRSAARPLVRIWSILPRAGAGLPDLFMFSGGIALFFGVVQVARNWLGPFTPHVEVSRRLSALPVYAGYSLIRIALAYVFSLAFAIAYGYVAAYRPRAERFMIPLLDVLQSIPVLSFLPGVMLAMAALFPGRQIGVEMGAVLLIFTGQVWNMAFSFYASMKNIPREMREAASIYRFNWWQRFIQIELPFSTIGLVWNSMMSVAGAWFFLMACEQFGDFRLPGLGSYLQSAADSGDTGAIILGIVTMIAVIVLIDQLVWRPVIAWAERFKLEQVESANAPTSWVLDFLRRSRGIGVLRRRALAPVREQMMHYFALKREAATKSAEESKTALWLWRCVAIVTIAAIAYAVVRVFMILGGLTGNEFHQLAVGLLATFLRVNLTLLIGALWTIPAGVAIGFNPRLARIAQPLAQIAASVPATALFPVVLLILIRLGGGLGLGSIVLLLLGTQWYILFNVIAGAMAIPTDLKEAASVFGIRGWQRWRKLILPGIFPFLITGLVTASGGAWNASIIAEYFPFKGHTYSTVGIGAIISSATATKNFDLLLASTIALAAVVVTTNRLLWRRLYRLAETRFKLES